jgi:glycosyltransferase involved in cell wall biosynthesis
VLEKGWRLSGFLSSAFRSEGVPAVLVENDIRFWTEPLDGVRSVGKYLLHCAAQFVATSCCRRLPLVVAETEELKTMLVARRGIAADRIQVVGLGVDHGLFHPLDQASARASLGVSRDVALLLYVGAMDEYHDLEPVIDALGQTAGARVRLHVVGDGEYRARCEAKAKQAGVKARFHGHVPHREVPLYIAAADLCIAPYRTTAFHGGVVTFSTLKIPEYMACGRPVVAVPGTTVQRLVKHGVSGFLFPNDVASWVSFLEALPPRERLASMGEQAARAVASVSWDSTATRYLEACEGLVERQSGHRMMN